MLRATLGLRSTSEEPHVASRPSWFRAWFETQVVALLQALSRRACTHPIHTLVFIAFMASAGYVGLLETDLFEPPAIVDGTLGRADVTSLFVGSKALHASSATAWKWQNGGRGGLAVAGSQVCFDRQAEDFLLSTL